MNFNYNKRQKFKQIEINSIDFEKQWEEFQRTNSKIRNSFSKLQPSQTVFSRVRLQEAVLTLNAITIEGSSLNITPESTTVYEAHHIFSLKRLPMIYTPFIKAEVLSSADYKRTMFLEIVKEYNSSGSQINIATSQPYSSLVDVNYHIQLDISNNSAEAQETPIIKAILFIENPYQFL